MHYTYGPPCFVNDSTRSLTTKGNKLYFKTLYVQGVRDVMEEGLDETILSVFAEYKDKFKVKEDKLLFKTYFDGK